MSLPQRQEGQIFQLIASSLCLALQGSYDDETGVVGKLREVSNDTSLAFQQDREREIARSNIVVVSYSVFLPPNTVSHYYTSAFFSGSLRREVRWP